jgi:hypothetical protein
MVVRASADAFLPLSFRRTASITCFGLGLPRRAAAIFAARSGLFNERACLFLAIGDPSESGARRDSNALVPSFTGSTPRVRRHTFR